MRFQQPDYLYLLLLLLTLLPFWFYRLTRTLRARRTARAPVRNLSSLSSKWADIGISVFTALALTALVLSLAQPQWVRQVVNPQLKKMDMVFLIDTSPSMHAEDIRPSRLERAL